MKTKPTRNIANLVSDKTDFKLKKKNYKKKQRETLF